MKFLGQVCLNFKPSWNLKKHKTTIASYKWVLWNLHKLIDLMDQNIIEKSVSMQQQKNSVI